MPIRTARIQDTTRRDHLVQKGADALALGDRKEALARYRTALEYDGEDDRLRAMVAQLAAACGEPREAAAEFAKVLDSRPCDPESWNQLGVLLMENGEREDAMRCWRRALDPAPRFGAASRNRKKAASFPRPQQTAPLMSKDVRAVLFAQRAPRLTVCVIAKDEAQLLPGCLDSVAEVAHEIVVVDTGSSDGTPDLARRHGAIVFTHAWRDDFAAARNEALKHAHGDWVLMIDADERLDPRDAAALRTIVEDSPIDYVNISIESVVGTETLATRAIRLYRNYPDLRYVGRIHEQLGASLRPLAEKFGIRGGPGAIRLRHLGYDPTHFVDRGKGERNQRLLDAELRDNPGNAYALLKHGEALFSQGKFAEAAPPIDEAWRLTEAAVLVSREFSILEEPGTLRGACALAGGRYQDTIGAIESLHNHVPPTANTRYLEGVARWALGMDGAGWLLEEAMETNERDGELFTLPEIKGATPFYILGAIALAGGDNEGARSRFGQALERDPEHRQARLGLAQALFQRGQPEGSVSLLAVMIERDVQDLAAWRAGGVYLVSSRGREQAAEAWLDAALTVFPGDLVLERLRTDLSKAGAS